MILHDLKATGGSNAKQMVLRRASEQDKIMFKYAYNPDNVFNMKYGNINWNSVKPLIDLDITILNKILDKTITGNKARDIVEYHCSLQGDLIKLIINKDLDCGITAKTLNKVFGKGFIKLFEAQKAIEIPIKDVKVPVLGQIKYNGIRCIAHVTNDEVVFRTYNGKVFKYDGLKDIIIKGNKYGLDTSYILDGELCIGDSKGTNHTQVKVNSSIRTGKSIVGLPYTFNVFESMLIEEFDNQVCNHAYYERFEHVKSVVNRINNPMVKLAETFFFPTHKQIEDKFNELLELGYEGMILKHSDHKYKFKKTKDWIKLKDVKTCDIKCIGVTDGEDKYEGMIGALVCKGIVEGYEVVVNVASGLSDGDRARKPEYFIGETIEIKYNSVILNTKTNEWSLFLGRYVTVRIDK